MLLQSVTISKIFTIAMCIILTLTLRVGSDYIQIRKTMSYLSSLPLSLFCHRGTSKLSYLCGWAELNTYMLPCLELIVFFILY